MSVLRRLPSCRGAPAPHGWFYVTILLIGACDGCSGIDELRFERGEGAFCSADLECTEGNFCEPNQERCVPLRENGGTCSADSNCLGGICSTGVCCDTPCADLACYSCADPANLGSCVPVEPNTDPNEDCSGTAACLDGGECEGAYRDDRYLGGADEQIAHDIAVSDDDVFLAGSYETLLPFSTSFSLMNAGGRDGFLARFRVDRDPAKPNIDKLEWALRFGAADDDAMVAVAVSGGTVCAAGWFQGTFDLAGSVLTSSNVAALVACFEAESSQLLFARTFEASGDARARDLIMTAPDRLVVVGEFSGDIELEPGVMLQAENGSQAFAMSLDADGDVADATLLPSELGEVVARAVARSGDDVVVAVDGRRPADGAGGMGPLEDDRDIYLCKLDEVLALSWGRSIQGEGHAEAGAVAVDGDGRVWLAGTSEGQILIDAGLSLQGYGASDALVAVYGPDNDLVTAAQFRDEAGLYAQRGASIVITPDGRALMAGTFQVAIRFSDDDLAPNDLAAVGGDDIFLVKLELVQTERSLDVTEVWAKPFGDELSETVHGLTTDGGGDIFLAGSFEYRINFGGGPVPSLGERDVFAAWLGP